MRRKERKRANPNEQNKMRTDYRSSWAKLIWKVYGKNPLKCPVCGCKMKVKEIVTEDVENELKRLNIEVWVYKEDEEICKVFKRGP